MKGDMAHSLSAAEAKFESLRGRVGFWSSLRRHDEAIQALENAKGQTSDSKTLNTLDTYIAKVRAHQAEEVR